MVAARYYGVAQPACEELVGNGVEIEGAARADAAQRVLDPAGAVLTNVPGKAQTELLRANINDQVSRLLDQLEDLEELKDGGTAEVVAQLLAAGACVNLASPIQKTVTHLAAAKGDATTLSLLLRASAVIHARDMNKWSALFHAARAGSVEVALHVRGLASGATYGGLAGVGGHGIEPCRRGRHRNDVPHTCHC